MIMAAITIVFVPGQPKAWLPAALPRLSLRHCSLLCLGSANQNHILKGLAERKGRRGNR